MNFIDMKMHGTRINLCVTVISSVQFKEAEDIYRSQGAFDFRSLGQLE